MVSSCSNLESLLNQEEKHMSPISRLRPALSVVFILTIAGAISVVAQTQTGRYPTSTILRADWANDPKKVEAAKPSVASAENTAADQAVEGDGEKGSNVIRSASVLRALTEPRLETGTAPRSPQAVDTDSWQFQFSPYFWMAGLHGTAGVGNRSTQVEERFSDVFHSLKFALMGVFEARKDKVLVLTDVEYISIGDDRATPGPLFSNLDAKFKLFIFDPEVGYRVFENPEKTASLDVLAGARVWRVSTDLAFGSGILPAIRVQGSRTWVDGVAGARVKAAVSKKAFVTAKADLGGGGSTFTYQLFGGFGYEVTPKIALIGGYRVLDVNYAKNNFVYDMNQRGPIMGLGFRF
jgi:hypothetical protein